MVRIASSYAGSLELVEGEVVKMLRLDVAHEVAHEWFYAAVGNDQYREAWLDESFAVYGEYVYQLYTGENESDVRERVMAFDGVLPQSTLTSAPVNTSTRERATATIYTPYTRSDRSFCGSCGRRWALRALTLSCKPGIQSICSKK